MALDDILHDLLVAASFFGGWGWGVYYALSLLYVDQLIRDVFIAIIAT